MESLLKRLVNAKATHTPALQQSHHPSLHKHWTATYALFLWDHSHWSIDAIDINPVLGRIGSLSPHGGHTHWLVYGLPKADAHALMPTRPQSLFAWVQEAPYRASPLLAAQHVHQPTSVVSSNSQSASRLYYGGAKKNLSFSLHGIGVQRPICHSRSHKLYPHTHSTQIDYVRFHLPSSQNYLSIHNGHS